MPFSAADSSNKSKGRDCLACGQPLGANRTNEHVIPEWLLVELGENEEPLIQIAANAITGEMKQARPPHPMKAFREGRACGKCNSGWMSELEVKTRPLLIERINGTRSASSLTEAERLVVARWTLKTAVVLSHAIGMGQPLPAEHLHMIRESESQLPARVGVFAATAAAVQNFCYRQRNEWLNVRPTDTPTELIAEDEGIHGIERAYKVSLQFRHILLIVAHLPRAAEEFVLAAGLHVPIWANPVLPAYAVNLDVGPPYEEAVLAKFNDSLGAIYVPDKSGVNKRGD